jgi:hypothetical protein
MSSWEGAAKLDWDRMQRPLLCDYVEFLLLTGMRHETESMRVQWRDCEWYEADVVIKVDEDTTIELTGKFRFN